MPKQRRSAQRWTQRFGVWWITSLTMRNLLVWLVGILLTAVLLPPLVLIILSSNYEAKFSSNQAISAKQVSVVYTNAQLDLQSFENSLIRQQIEGRVVLVAGEQKTVNEAVAQELVEAGYDQDTIKVDYTYISPVPLCKYIRQNFPNQRVSILANRWEIHRMLFACSSLGIDVEGRLIENDWNLAGIMGNSYQLMSDLVQIHLY